MLTRPSLPLPIMLAVAVAAGLLLGLGQAPLGVWPATIVGVGLFTWLMISLRGRAAFGLGYLVGAELADGIVSSLVTLAIGCGLYLATATRFAPEQTRLLLGAIKPASKPASA